MPDTILLALNPLREIVPLSPNTLTVLSYWEQIWFLNHRLPTLNETAEACSLAPPVAGSIIASEDFQTACANRGIDASPQAKLLTPEQLALANTLLDLTDTRTPTAKLKALGVSPRKYSAWQKQPAFRNYLQRRSEELFGDALPEAHTALMRNIQTGDLASIKLFYEISGRWSSKTVGELNVEFLMMKIIDILARRLAGQPGLLAQIADDLNELTPGTAGINVDQNPLKELEFEDFNPLS